MQYEVPAIVETKLTGYLGSAFRNVKKVTYQVRFTMQAGQITGLPLRDGKGTDWSPLTVKMYHSGVKFFGRAAA